jgi:hypothetical protein
MVGPVPIGMSWNRMNSTAKGAFRRGARIRRNSRLSVINTIFMGYRNTLMYDGDSTYNYSGAKTSSFPNFCLFRNNVIVNSDSGYYQSSPWKRSADGLVEVVIKDSSTLSTFNTWVRASTNANKVNPVAYTAGTLLVDPKNPTTPDFRPVSGSPALNASNYSFNVLIPYGTFNSVNNIAEIESYNVYPNPAVNNINAELQLSKSITAQIKIVDLTGKTVKDFGNQNLNAGTNVVTASVEGVQNGIYLLTITGNGANFSTRVIINH